MSLSECPTCGLSSTGLASQPVQVCVFPAKVRIGFCGPSALLNVLFDALAAVGTSAHYQV